MKMYRSLDIWRKAHKRQWVILRPLCETSNVNVVDSKWGLIVKNPSKIILPFLAFLCFKHNQNSLVTIIPICSLAFFTFELQFGLLTMFNMVLFLQWLWTAKLRCHLYSNFTVQRKDRFNNQRWIFAINSFKKIPVICANFVIS